MANNAPRRPDWQLPQGVTRGTWDYLNSDLIAEDYDKYFSYSQMFKYDAAVLQKHVDCSGKPWVIDLGCGTGRAALQLAEAGAQVLAVDLSQHMLDITLNKAEAADLQIGTLRANLVQLDAVESQTMDYAVCLFSTLGMIHGAENRLQALRHVRRILKSGGTFVLHVHNIMANLTDPGGCRWLLRSVYQQIKSPSFEMGDKHFAYRGLPSMFLHTFAATELRKLLKSAQLELVEWIPVDATAGGPLRCGWLLPSWRASGWIVVARRGN